MTSGVKYSELLAAATAEEYVLQYNTFQEFADDVDDILYQTCRVFSTPVNLGDGQGHSLNISGILLGDSRVIQLTFPGDQVLLIELSSLANNDSLVEVIYTCDDSIPNKANYQGKYNLTMSSDRSSLEFPLTCTDNLQVPGKRNLNRRSANGNETIDDTNSTSAIENITASVAFTFASTFGDCQLCSLDLSLNITQIDAETWRSLLAASVGDNVQDLIPEDEIDWLFLVLVVLVSLAIVIGLVAGLCCLVEKCIEFKNNQIVGVYNDHEIAYKSEVASTKSAQLTNWYDIYNNSSHLFNYEHGSPGARKETNYSVEELFVPVFKISEGPVHDW
ncbi:uncharacterized protein LOC142356081 [Convolutriloba macropyga]|uniref:uncharacterized protein LOC142356081 n=1 Tax=Convolutriloba macropyga TaxID=536237 RepID=UPI003F5244F0